MENLILAVIKIQNPNSDKFMIIFFILAAIIVGVYTTRVNINNQNSPKVTESVTVIRKINSRDKYRRRICYLRVEFDDGKKLWMNVEPEVFDRIEKGETGKLTHQGTLFIDYVGTGF